MYMHDNIPHFRIAATIDRNVRIGLRQDIAIRPVHIGNT